MNNLKRNFKYQQLDIPVWLTSKVILKSQKKDTVIKKN